MKYRKKQVVIEAFKYSGHGFDKKPEWFQDAIRDGIAFINGGVCIIKTLEGNHRANAGDYIIRGIKGELYPCKPDIFEATYEAVDHPTES